MTSTAGSAQLLISEFDAAPLSWQPRESADGAATLIQQASEASQHILRRALKRALHLRVSGYVLGSAFFVLGSAARHSLTERLAIAEGLFALLGAEQTTLHLVSTSAQDQLAPFLLADELRKRDFSGEIRLHFQAFPLA
jgi:hypothetical protein